MVSEREGVQVRAGFLIPEPELHFSYVRSSGPGGQKVNKTATKTRLKWWPVESGAAHRSLSGLERARFLRKCASARAEDGSIQIVSDRFRTQETNRADCRRRLAEQIRAWLRRPKKRIPTKPTRASKERRIQEKQRISRLKKTRRKPADD